jgi:hypothetical protein
MRLPSARQQRWAKQHPQEVVGARIKELEDDKKAQGEYFDDMEVEAEPPERIYMDGVMINSKRMEGKVAIVWSKRELVKSDIHIH